MKLVLKENIRGLGSTGDVVTVKSGYARNFLLPQGKAVFPSTDLIAQLQRERERYLSTEKTNIDSARGRSEALEGLKLDIAMKANEAGQLFGSVTESIVAEALSARLEREFKPQQIIIGSHFKRIGEYLATVRLHSEVEVEIGLNVLAEESEDAREERLLREEEEAERLAAAEAGEGEEGEEGEESSDSDSDESSREES